MIGEGLRAAAQRAGVGKGRASGMRPHQDDAPQHPVSRDAEGERFGAPERAAAKKEE